VSGLRFGLCFGRVGFCVVGCVLVVLRIGFRLGFARLVFVIAEFFLWSVTIHIYTSQYTYVYGMREKRREEKKDVPVETKVFFEALPHKS
jgi:hypothetical protein